MFFTLELPDNLTAVNITNKNRFFSLLLLAISIGFPSTAQAFAFADGEVTRYDIICSGDTADSYKKCISGKATGTAEKISIQTRRPPVFNLATKRLERGAGNHPILFIPDDPRFLDYAKSAGDGFPGGSAVIKRPINLPGAVPVSYAQNFASYILTAQKIIPKRGLISAPRIRPPPHAS